MLAVSPGWVARPTELPADCCDRCGTQDTEWTIVAVYVPATAPPGNVISISGSQAAEVSLSTLMALTMGCGSLDNIVWGAALKLASPVAELKPVTS